MPLWVTLAPPPSQRPPDWPWGVVGGVGGLKCKGGEGGKGGDWGGRFRSGGVVCKGGGRGSAVVP